METPRREDKLFSPNTCSFDNPVSLENAQAPQKAQSSGCSPGLFKRDRTPFIQQCKCIAVVQTAVVVSLSRRLVTEDESFNVRVILVPVWLGSNEGGG